MSVAGEGPGEIRRLNEDVVNRIAAGEIIQRPANALKELLENCLDAKSTNVMITVKAGGLKYLQDSCHIPLQGSSTVLKMLASCRAKLSTRANDIAHYKTIQDNGCGIRHSDLGIVCERFTTSKLREYDELREISTYGFRGEALASISHIAHLTVLTKTAADKCAYKASYEDGKLKGPIKACAGNNGTQITVEDLFYNVLTRKRALRSPAEEYSHVMEVVGSYAIHNSSVGFTLKKFGEKTDIKTAPNSTVVDNVRVIYGNSVARSLMELQLDDENLRLRLRGYVTDVNYSHRRGTMLLFINHRLVESVAIRKAIDSVYATYLPKNSHSFVYLSLELDPRTVDVNVHPCKQEVRFLHEEQVVERLRAALEAELLSCNTSRVMYTQARLPGATIVEEDAKKPKDPTKVYAHNLVRMSSDTQKIDKFFPPVNTDMETKPEKVESIIEQPKIISDEPVCVDMTAQNIEDVEDEREEHRKEKWKPNVATVDSGNVTYIDPKESFKTRTFQYERIETKLTSIKQLRMDVENSCNSNLREVLANLIFIGCVDPHRSLIQHSTKLYLCDTTKLTEELFYECLLYDFQNFGLIRLSQPLPLQELLLLALKVQHEDWQEELGEPSALAQQMCSLLVSKRAMLLEYFSLEVGAEGDLHALPLLLDGHTPYMGALPTYLVRLVSEVNWDQEKACFDTFCRQTAIFYSQPNPESGPEASRAEEWKQEHVIYPAIRKNFLPPGSFVTNGAILQIANLSDLYKVFERC